MIENLLKEEKACSEFERKLDCGHAGVLIELLLGSENPFTVLTLKEATPLVNIDRQGRRR